MPCKSCAQRGKYLRRAITAAREGDSAGINRNLRKVGRSFQDDGRRMAIRARQKLAAFTSNPGS